MSFDISVVIPTKDRVDFLSRAVASCLDQEASDLRVEVVVVDDGSTDGTSAWLKAAPSGVISLRHERPLGRGCSRNDGMGAARGEFVKFLDDDDLLEPGGLREELRIGRAAGAAVVASAWRTRYPDGSELVSRPPTRWIGVDSLLAGDAVPTGAAMYRRDYLQGVQWSEKLVKIDDWLFFLRACLKGGTIVSNPKPAYCWVQHAGQSIVSVGMLDHAREFYLILDELEESIRAKGQMTPEREKRLAQYRYKELRVLSLEDREAFEREVVRILSLDGEFVPTDEERQWWMRLLAMAVGFRRAVVAHSAVKRRVRGLIARPVDLSRDHS